MTVLSVPSRPPGLVPSLDPLSLRINRLPLSHSLLSILHDPSDTTGRRAIARCALSPARLIIRETACPSVLHASFVHKVCAGCYEALHGGLEGGREEVKVRGCRACERVFYCTTKCLMADVDRHRDECRALREVDRISDESRVNVDLVRAALTFIVQSAASKPSETTTTTDDDDNDSADRRLSPNAAATTADVRADDFVPTWEDVSGMVDNLSSLSPIDHSQMSRAAALLLAALPADVQERVPAAAVVSFMSRVNNNSHALSMASSSAAAASSAAHVGFGLFPLCSILNHSCYPNCIYVSEGRRMCMRVIRDVREGEELTVNYVGLYASLEARRRELRESKKFVCECRRCTLRPASDEERDKFAFDQYVGGVRCRKDAGKGKRCAGIYRLMEPIVPSQRTPAAVERKEDAGDGQTQPENASAIDDVLLCGECGDGLRYSELQAVEAEYGNKVEAALSLYSQQASSPSTLYSYLTSLTSTLMTHFHPHHHLIFNLSLPLINLLSALQQPRDKLLKVRSVRLLSSHVYPPHYLPSVNYAEAEVAAITAVAGGGRMPAKLKAKYAEEQTALLRYIVEALRVCMGEDSVQVRRAERQLTEHLQAGSRGGA